MYYIKEKRLSRIISGCLQIDGLARGSRLSDWRQDEVGSCNLSLLVQSVVLVSEHSPGKVVNIAHVNDTLDGLNALTDCSDDAFQLKQAVAILSPLILQMNSLELKWLTRLILKDLQLDIDYFYFFNAFHPLMSRIYKM